MKKLLFLPLLAALLMAACGDSEDDTMPQNPEPILLEDELNQPDEVDTSGAFPADDPGKAFYLCEGSLVDVYYEPVSLNVYFNSLAQGYLETGFFIFIDKDEENGKEDGTYWYRSFAKYKDYSAYYGDTTYSADRPMSRDYKVSAMPLSTISITADRDFDAEHPAGSLLNDYFVLEYSSAYDAIKSGYDPALDITDDRWHSEYDAYQLMPLSEFEPINLLHYNVILYFTKLPEKLGEYTFTISFEYGTDPVSGKEASKIAPAVIKAVFTEADYVNVPVREPLNKGE